MPTIANANSATKDEIRSLTVGPKNVYVPPQPANAEVAILAAIVSIGTGTVYLGDGTYQFGAALDLSGYSGISIVGVGPVFQNSGSNDVFDAGRRYLSGTKLVGDGTFQGIIGNATDQGSPAAAFGDNTLQGIGLENLYFENFTNPIKFGAVNNMGVYGGFFKNLWLYNNLAAAEFHNFVHSDFVHLYDYSNTTTSGGGWRFIASVASAVLIPGNSTFRQIVCLREKRLHNGIRFEAFQGAKLNECSVRRLETLSFGEAVTTVAATCTNDGTGNITVPDGTVFPVGTACTFSASVNGLITQREYFVTSQVSNVIQVATNCPVNGLAPVAHFVTTGTTAVNISTGGYPLLSIIGYDDSSISNFEIEAIDLEGKTGAGSGAGIVGQGLYNVKFSMSGISGVFDAHHILRATVGNAFVRVFCDEGILSTGFTTDWDSASYNTFYMGQGRGPIRNIGAGEGWWNGHMKGHGNVTITAGAVGIIGTTGTAVAATGGTLNVPTTQQGDILLTTGAAGVTAPGTLFTLTFNPNKERCFAHIFPLNANAAAFMAANPGAIHQNYTIRATGIDVISDVALALNTAYIFGYMSF